MLRVIIESPFGRNPDGSKCTPEEYERNRVYALRCLADSLSRGEAPFASHALYPLVLDDTNQEARRLGMEAGFAWGAVAELCALYDDYGVTDGMRQGAVRHNDNGIFVDLRFIGKNP